MIKFFEKENKLSWFITIVTAGTIFYISSLTFGPGTPGTNILSITYHVSAFFFLGFFLLISLVKGEKRNLIALSIMIAIFYAITDELHQFFVLGRGCAFSDVLLDSIGIMSASVFYVISLKFRRR